jgi:propionyl-CoA synthetase
VQSYLAAEPGYYLSGDAGYIDDDGYLFVMSRIDDIINVAGHRLSTGGMEAVLAAHPDVAECAVIGVADQLKGELPLGLVVLKAGVDRRGGDRSRAGQAGARADRPGGGLQVRAGGGALPKTRSGKILRGTMKSIADGTEYRMPATIDDPAILEEIEAGAVRGRLRNHHHRDHPGVAAKAPSSRVAKHLGGLRVGRYGHSRRLSRSSCAR